MTYKNFTLATDADGIALVTWDMPGKSMNVFTEEVMEELNAIVDATVADSAVKGVVIGSDGVQLLGGHGFIKEHPVERWYRDLRAAGMMEGVVLV